MLREVGSNFWLPHCSERKTDIDDRLFGVVFEDSAYTSTGRGAISLVLSDLGNIERKALLPSYTCESVIEPFARHGYQVRYYDVEEGLQINGHHFVEEVTHFNPSVILVHRYFGFDTANGVRRTLEKLKCQGAVVIEDLTQTLYSRLRKLPANYYVGSFRKWDGIPDGGFVLKEKGSLGVEPTDEDARLLNAKIEAMKAKYEYVLHGVGSKDAFLEKFADAEAMISEQSAIHRMSSVSYRMQANLEVDALVRARRSNFEYLLMHLNKANTTPLFDFLPGDVTPLYFPILCDGNRKLIQARLRDCHIYAPIVWPKPDSIPRHSKGAGFFYKNLLCIPCDQRYGLEEMEYVAMCMNCSHG